MENIDAIYFINLDHRQDRCKEFMGEIEKLGYPKEKVIRISAIHKPAIGALGCTLSHIKTLDTFLKSTAKNCIIFEDDFQFTLDINYCKFLFKSLFQEKVNFDVVMLSGNVMKEQPTNYSYLNKIIDAQTASGYLIQRSFAQKLKECLEESAKCLEEYWNIYQVRKHEYCLDIYWKQLQPQHNWFIFKPKLGLQRESYSDNELKITNYGV